MQNALFHLGRLAFNNRQPQKAISALTRVVTINPSHSDAHYALGLAYEQLKDRVKAKAAYQKALDLNPQNAELKAKVETLD